MQATVTYTISFVKVTTPFRVHAWIRAFEAFLNFYFPAYFFVKHIYGNIGKKKKPE